MPHLKFRSYMPGWHSCDIVLATVQLVLWLYTRREQPPTPFVRATLESQKLKERTPTVALRSGLLSQRGGGGIRDGGGAYQEMYVFIRINYFGNRKDST